MKNNIKLKPYGLGMIRESLRALMPTGEKPRHKIDVQQRGLATGQVVSVRVIKRVHIPVKYIPSN